LSCAYLYFVSEGLLDKIIYPESSNRKTYEGLTQNGSPHGNGLLLYKNGDIYSGSFIRGLMDGFGVFTFSRDHPFNASLYTGQFKQGLKHGNGTFMWTDGKRYVGHFEDGYRSGFGVLYFNKQQQSERYEGNFLKSKLHGKGTLYWRNGDIYEGSFVNDLIDGFGVFTFSKKNVYGNKKYSGYFKDNQMNGNGTMISNDGYKYVGMFKNNFRHGFGILYYPEQDLRDRYEGYHEKGFFEGQGRMYGKDGTFYVGHFSEDLPNGFGIEYTAQGSVHMKGMWNNGRLAFAWK